jgi:hypothetical protein
MEDQHGSQNVKKRFQRREVRNAQAKEGNAEERQRKESDEQEAGDRDRFVGSPQEGKEGREEKIEQVIMLTQPFSSMAPHSE